jgi:hypothetical protein
MIRDPARIIESKHRLPHGGRQLSWFLLGSATGQLTRCEQDSVGQYENEIGTRGTQVHVPSVEDRYVLLAIQYMIIDWFTWSRRRRVELLSNDAYDITFFLKGVPLVALYM